MNGGPRLRSLEEMTPQAQALHAILVQHFAKLATMVEWSPELQVDVALSLVEYGLGGIMLAMGIPESKVSRIAGQMMADIVKHMNAEAARVRAQIPS